MRNRFFIPGACAALCALSFASCQDDAADIGGSLASGEISITIDTIYSDLHGRSVNFDSFDARTMDNLIGHLDVKGYGVLDCSYAARLLCSPNLGAAASASMDFIDGLEVVMAVPRGALTGDSLAPQRVAVYELTGDLPSDVSSSFDISSSYNPETPLSSSSFVLSALGTGVTSENASGDHRVSFPLDRSFLEKTINAYRDNPEFFQWPSSFAANFLKGIYVRPVFGNGCIANVSSTAFVLKYHYNKQTTVVENGMAVEKTVQVNDSLTLFATAPDVLNTNLISYEPCESLKQMAASGKAIVTSPGRFNTRITIPAEKLLERFRANESSLSSVSNLTFAIPASEIENEFGITVPPFLAMVKTSELDDFFMKRKTPDGVNSFWAQYSGGYYVFSSLREYIQQWVKGGNPTPEDMDFTLVPVNITTETKTSNSGSQIVVSSCLPYMSAPAMALLDTGKASFIFTFSRQTF